jgi:hypothetical protein
MRRIRSIIRAFMVILISLAGFLLVAFILINLPFSHRFVTKKVNGIFSSSRLPLHIGSVVKVLPWAVYVQAILIHDSHDDTIVYAGKVRSGLRPLALLKKKLILQSVYLEHARVNLLRNKGEDQLNIAEAFSQGKESDQPDQKARKQLEISVADAEVKDLNFIMSDSVAGIYVSETIEKINFVTRVMSLTGKTLIAKSLRIEGSTGSLTLNGIAKTGNSGSDSPWNFGIGDLSAVNINFVLDDPVNRQRFDLLAGGIEIKTRETDINKKIISFDKISLFRTSAVLHMDSQAKKPVKPDTTKSGPFPWDIEGDRINLQDLAFQMIKYSDTADYTSLSGFSVIGLNMKLSDLRLNKTNINASIEDMKFDLGNGFSMKDMSGIIDSRSGITRINLDIKTASSEINFRGLSDREIFDIIENPAGMQKANLSLTKTNVSLADIFYFRPDLQKIPGVSTLAARPLAIAAEIKLDGAEITVPHFSISQVNSAGVSFNGKIGNIFKPQNSICDLKFRLDEINKSWLSELLNELKPGFSLPDYKTLSLEGSIKDSLRAPEFNISIRSDLGIIDLNGSFDFNHDRFSLKTQLGNLKVGKILNNLTFGSFSGSGEINGSGIINKSPDARALIQIDSFGVRDYVYINSEIECTVRPGKYDLKAYIHDPSLKVDLHAGLTTDESGIAAYAKGTILADLYDLRFLKDSIIVKGTISADILKNRDNFKTVLDLSEIKIATPHDSATIHKITASLKSDSLETILASGSDFFSLSAHIAKSVGTLGKFVGDYTKYLSSRINIHKRDSIEHEIDLPLINGEINLSYAEALKLFVPDTTLYFKNISFSFNKNEGVDKISYSLKGKGLKYKLIELGNLNTSLSDSSGTLDLNLLADTCKMGPQLINRIQIRSHFRDWKSLTSLSVIDSRSKLNYNFEVSSTIDSNYLIVEFPSRQMILNSAMWQMDSPKFLRINLKTKVIFPSLKMHTDSSFISFLNEEEKGWMKYKLELKNVGLSSFFNSELVPGNPHLFISGFSTYESNESLGNRLTTDLKFTDAGWYGLSYKKLTLNGFLKSDTTGNYNFEINTTIDTAEVKIKGQKTGKINTDISAQFKLIPVNTAEPFVRKYLSDLKGTVSGEFAISKRDEVNDFKGNLYINKGDLRINILNSSYRLPDDSINFAGKRMVFNNFKVLDSLGNELLVNGFIDFEKKNQVMADLGIASSNLKVLNKKEDKNATFYGDVFIDSKLSVKGPVNSPVLKGKITLAKGTDIYFRQSENLNISESGTVLTFVDHKPSAGQKGKNSELKSSIYNKSSVESVVEIDPSTRFNIDISKKMFNIDMTVLGGGELNYNMLVNSQVNLNGKYEISEGGANLKMVGWPNKAFKLTKGGFIRWDGKLEDPDLKLEAINRVKSSYVNPVDNKERYVDFDVTLKISNRLSAMDVSFTISTQDQYLMSIINTMSPEEQMRQAITILLFEYIDLPGISTSSNYVSEQVNQMVAAQLNSLTKTTIKGIDISFGIDTYTQGTSSGGQQTKTSLSYEVKKNLLNDRAKIEFSGIVSDPGSQSNTSNTSLNNFTFEYRIDSAATKFLKVYNEHTYEDVFEGDVVKTGVGFKYRKSYPSLKDIWRREEKNKKQNNPDR